MTKTAMIAALGLGLALGGCAGMGPGKLVRTAKACQDVHIPIYFEPDAADLTPEGRALIATEAGRVGPCKVDAVQVVGLADAVGDPAANMELSKKRAASVADAIVKAGLPAAEFDLAAAGQAGSVTKSGEVAPVRRRADVTLKLSRPK
jgi:outer membrane protein OmpA-like peptidoglycan-associated protein